MHKFIKFSFTANAKNTQFCSLIISAPTLNKKSFSTTTVQADKPEKVNKYSDKYKLSKDEVQAILKKPKKKPNVMVQTEVERADIRGIYEKSIEEQLGSLRFNTVKEFNTKLEVAQKMDLSVPQTRPSDRPDVKYYKYDLPIPNIDPEIQGLDDIFERERAKRVTVNQNVWEVLDLGAEDSYQDYEKGLAKKFNFEMDMYGDVTNVEEKRNHEIEVKGEDVLPMLRINNESYMGTLRNCFSLNINMPGTLENEDPNKFIRGLRPVEEFRHTPLVPISERVMNEHKKKLEAYHRGGLYFEVKKETLASYGIFLSFIFLGYNLFTWLMEKEEEVSVSYERLKLRRIQQS